MSHASDISYTFHYDIQSIYNKFVRFTTYIDSQLLYLVFTEGNNTTEKALMMNQQTLNVLYRKIEICDGADIKSEFTLSNTLTNV